MHDSRVRQPAFGDAGHSGPGDGSSLAAPVEGLLPETGQVGAEGPQGLAVAGDAVVLDVAAQHALEPSPHRVDALMHASPQFLPEAPELGRASGWPSSAATR